MFLPLGVALEARQLYPRLVDRGRSQVVLARLMGRYATKQAVQSADRIMGRASDDTASILRLVGLLPQPTQPAEPQPQPSTVDRHIEGHVHDVVERPFEDPVDLEPPPSSDHLAIPDYDSLAASQVVPRLEALTPEELDAVRAYEEIARGRKTILAKIAQLQTP